MRPWGAFCLVLAVLTLGSKPAIGQCPLTYVDLLRAAPQAPINYVRWEGCKCIWWEEWNIPPGLVGHGPAIDAAAAPWNQETNGFDLDDICTTPGSTVVDITYFHDLPWIADRDLRGETTLYWNTFTGFAIHAYVQINMSESGDAPLSTWTTTCEPYQNDLTSVLIHEFGHALGLQHIDDWPERDDCEPYSVMTRMNPDDCALWLRSFDTQAILALYPNVTVFSPPQGVPIVTVPAGCPKVDDDPIAAISSFDVLDGTVAWHVDKEDGTQEYVIEGCNSMDGPGEILRREEAGLGWHEVDLPGTPYRYYRLLEIEYSGRQLVHGVEAEEHRTAQQRPADTSPVGLPKPPKSDPEEFASMTGDPTIVVFYDDPAYASYLQTYVAPVWASLGHVVSLVDVSGYTKTARAQQIHSQIINDNSAYGTDLFHFVGTWKGGPAVPGDTLSSADQQYADLDDDKRPDVVVTRWPVEDVDDLSNIWSKEWFHRNTGGYKAGSTAMFLGDVSLQGNSGQYVVDIGLELAQVIEDNDASAVISETNWGDYADDSARNTAAADTLETLDEDAVVIVGTSSTRWDPGKFFDADPNGYDAVPWTMSLINESFAQITPVMVAASCHGAAWGTYYPSPYYPDRRPPIYQFLFDDAYNGAIAWTGPTAASLQYANYVFSYYFLQELYTEPSRSMARSWLSAMHLARLAFSNSPDHLATLESYVLLADPVSMFQTNIKSTLTASARDATTGSMGAFPGSVATGSPAGSLDDIVVAVTVEFPEIVPDAADLRVETKSGSSIELFCEAAADSAFTPNYVGDEYYTTVTIDEYATYGGCGVDSLVVYLDRFLLGYVEINTQSVDVAEGSYGLVNLVDLAVLGTAWQATPTDSNYNWCVDYNDDAVVNLPDMSLLGGHFNDTYDCGPPASREGSPVVAASAGTVYLDFVEHSPLIGQSTLTVSVSLQGVEPYTVMFLALKNENPMFTFTEWTQSSSHDGTTMVTEVIRHGQREVVLGIVNDQAEGGDILLGSFDVTVMTNEGVHLTPDDFALVTGEFLGTGQQVSQRQAYVFGKSLSASRNSTPMVYANELAQNYPNPFNPSTTISFSLAQREHVELSIYDVTGALVQTLVNNARESGNHRILWNGLNSSGISVATGIYFYRLVMPGFTATKKMVLIR